MSRKSIICLLITMTAELHGMGAKSSKVAVEPHDMSVTLTRPNSGPITQTYHIDYFIGSGSKGKVYHATSDGLPGRELAIKVPAEFLEVLILNDPNIFSGQYVIQQYFWGTTPSGELCSVQEYANGGSLKDFMAQNGFLKSKKKGISGPKLEQEWLPIFERLMDIVRFLHSKNIAHEDFRDENLFIVDGVIKIGDFGSATGEKSLGNDVESLGKILYTFVYGEEPDYKIDRNELERSCREKLEKHKSKWAPLILALLTGTKLTISELIQSVQDIANRR